MQKLIIAKKLPDGKLQYLADVHLNETGRKMFKKKPYSYKEPKEHISTDDCKFIKL